MSTNMSPAARNKSENVICSLRNAGTVYHAHVDGLRAFAVFFVIFFHLHPEVLPGGYLGVDIFFVISGYLITAILRDKTRSSGSFSFQEFYIRRIRRLFPALALTLFLSLVVATFVMPRALLMDVGNQLVAVMLYASNIWYWSQDGYWDDASDTKLLLHTWSLSVEEQFYIFWPLFVWSLSGQTDQNFARSIFGVVMMSLLLNVCWGASTNEWLMEDSATAFFWTPFRMFEFALGSLTSCSCLFTQSHAIYTDDKYRVVRTIVACLSITGPVLYPCSDSLPLFFVALLPCLGTAILIRDGNKGIANSVLSNSVIVKTGAMSYSMYLVHWPIIVFYKVWYLRSPDIITSCCLAGLTFFLGWISHKFIETPFRASKEVKEAPSFRSTFMIGWAMTSITLILAGLLATNIADVVLPNASSKLDAQHVLVGKLRRHSRVTEGCHLADFFLSDNGTLSAGPRCHLDRKLQVLIYGNSHEEDGYNSLDFVYGNSIDVNLISFGATNRLVQKHVVPFQDQSPEFMRAELLYDVKFLSKLDVFVISFFGAFGETEYPTKQIYSYWWPWFVANNILERNPDINIIAFGPYIGTLTRDCHVIYGQVGSFDACTNPKYIVPTPPPLIPLSEIFNERKPPQSFIDLRGKLFAAGKYLYIDVLSMLCPTRTLASCMAERDGEPWAYDRHHKSMALSEHIGELMVVRYDDMLQKFGFPAQAELQFHFLDYGIQVVRQMNSSSWNEQIQMVQRRADKQIALIKAEQN